VAVDGIFGNPSVGAETFDPLARKLHVKALRPGVSDITVACVVGGLKDDR
jgi:hypothetical protein